MDCEYWAAAAIPDIAPEIPAHCMTLLSRIKGWPLMPTFPPKNAQPVTVLSIIGLPGSAQDNLSKTTAARSLDISP